MGSFFRGREPVEPLQALKKHFFVKEMVRKEIQILGPPVADLERQPRPADQVKTVNQLRRAQGQERSLGSPADRFAAPLLSFVMGPSGSLSGEPENS
jgi:hypothetical protein